MVEYRKNDRGVDRKNSYNRSYRNYRIHYAGAALIEQHTCI